MSDKRKLAIVVLQRGWVYVGYRVVTGTGRIRVENARCIRYWARSDDGLSRLALRGPGAEDKLDAPVPSISYHPMQEIVVYDDVSGEWGCE